MHRILFTTALVFSAASSSRAGCGALLNSQAIEEQRQGTQRLARELEATRHELALARAELANRAGHEGRWRAWAEERIRRLDARVLQLERDLEMAQHGRATPQIHGE